MWFATLACVGEICAQEVDQAQPAPKAVPVDDLLPEFKNDGNVLSHSKQFRISGGDLATRGMAANLAEESKEELLRLTGEKDVWKVQIIVEFRGVAGEPVPLRDTVFDLWHNEMGYELKIFHNLSRGLRKESFNRAVLTALLYERGLRGAQQVHEDVPLTVPSWLVEGLEEATAWRLKQSDRRLYDALFRHGGLFKMDDIFAMTEEEFAEIDAASKAAFRVSSGALVMALLDQPQGQAGMRAFLAELPTFDGEVPALLRKHFPELNLSLTSLEKWWALQLANKGSAPLTEVLDVVRTERMLNEALKLRYQDGEDKMQEVSISEWERLAGLDVVQKVESVRLAQDDLLRLSYRCFPSYRPLLIEYQAVLTDFSKGNTKNLAQTLGALAETRGNMLVKAERARDFLDWFEITRARETSGVFEDYLKLKARLKANPKHRKDGLSEYLDRLDPLFVVPEEEDQFSLIGDIPQF